MSSNDAQLQRIIFKAFKSRGLSIQADASRALSRVLSQEVNYEDAICTILDEIKQRIEKREIVSNVVNVQSITKIVADLTSNDDDLNQDSLQLFDAFHSPKLHFDERSKVYSLETGNYTLFPHLESRTAMYRDRLLLAQQRLLRNTSLRLQGLGGGTSRPSRDGTEALSISTVESLLGAQGENRILFGMITQPEEGRWFLEDLSGTIPLNLHGLPSPGGLVTEGSIVAVEGRGSASMFDVQHIMLPPAEERSASISAIGMADTFGTGLRPQSLQHLESLEAESSNTMFLVISDIQLDQPVVVDKLLEVFQGFEATYLAMTGQSQDDEVPESYDNDFSNVANAPNLVFILMGSFVTKPIAVPGGRQAAQATFTSLAEIIASCPHIAANAKFVLVPGPEDPGNAGTLPRFPFPKIFTKELSKKVKHVSFATNPCRLRFFTQEIVIFRDDLLKKMQRHLVMPPDLSEGSPSLVDQQVKAILDQGHLCPLPAHVRPIHWELDHAMRLFPLPHLLILGDTTEQFSLTYGGCLVVNPGSFSSDFSFVVYRPSTKEVEFSKVPS